jgi:hypothetical protein
MTNEEIAILKSLPNYRDSGEVDDEEYILVVNITGDLVRISGVIRVETDERRDEKGYTKYT